MDDKCRCRGEPVAWTLTQQQVIALAEELIVGASDLGGMDDDGIECDVRLMVRMPGTVADDDGKLNERPILAICLEKYPEEGVYPIDPANCETEHPAPQPQQQAGGEPVARVNNDGFIVETGLGLAPGTLLFTAPQPQQQAGEAVLPGRVCGYTPGQSRVEIQMPSGTAMTGLLELGSEVFISAAPQPQQIPEGYKLVPIDPTEEMMRCMELRTHSDEDMRDYAIAAIEADRKEPDDIELPKPFMTVYDDADKVEVGCYSEIQVRAAIEADRKLQHRPVYEEGWKDALEWADRKRRGESVAWEMFPGYLIEQCEGEIITEEGLQRALADMLGDPEYTPQPAEPVKNRKAFICPNCEGVYADQPVSQCDCVPDKNEFIEGTISYPATQPAEPEETP